MDSFVYRSQGAKAAQKRERNAANGPKGASAEAKAKSVSWSCF